MAEQIESGGRVVVGKVVSNKMHKTIIVEVERKVKHPLYGKYLKRASKMSAHDDQNTCKIGDIVEIKQSRPISKNKHWVLVKILNNSSNTMVE